MQLPHEFVCRTYERSSFEKHVPAPIFRKTFHLEDSVSSAELIIGAPGFYELSVNGEPVTKGQLAPYIANPDDLVYFDRYDVAPYLREGENVIGLTLGDGFQNMIDSVWDFDHARHNGSPRFALTLDCDAVTFTAKDFVCSSSEITFNSYRCGVHVDARLKQDGWKKPGFDASSWQAVLPAEMPRGEFRLCEADPINIIREIEAVSIKQGKLVSGPARPDVTESFKDVDIVPVPIDDENGFIFDFGINTAGIFRLKIKGEPGQHIVLQVAERLKDGAVDPTNISFFYPEGYGQRDVYICRGDEEEIFVPPFVYHGGRYVYVSGITEEQATEDLLVFLEMHSDLKQRAMLETSDETVNTLWQMALRSDLTNFHYFPTDCPHREKNGWTGDASMSAEHMLFTLEAEHSFTEWMRSVCKAQNAAGALPGIVPTTGWGFDWGNGPAWDSVLFNLPYYTYIYSGQTKIVEESSESMLRYLDYISRQRDARGLVEIGLGDWCPVGRGADDYLVPLGFTDSVMILDMCRKGEVMFSAIDLPLSASFARTLGDEIRASIRQTYLDPATMLITGHSQSGQAMGIYYNVFDNSEKLQAFEHLLQMIREDDESMNVGFLGGRVIFHVLSDFGYSDLAYHMITKKEYPSYGHLLERGATTLWEMFLPEGRLSGSENHHFWGDINHWFLRQLAGINVNPRGHQPNRIIIKPHFVEALDWVKGEYNGVHGIQVEWQRTSDHEGINLMVTAEEGLQCDLELPSGYYFKDSGRTYLSDAEAFADGRTVDLQIVQSR